MSRRRRWRLFGLLVLLGVVAGWAWLWPRAGGEGESATVCGQGPEPAPAPEAAPRRAGRAPERPSEERIAAARRWMKDGGREARCGPYRLVTDVREGRLLEACERIGSALDRVYGERFGIEPVGAPAEAILLFAELEGFRAFVAQEGHLRVGYAGFAAPAYGYLALHADGTTLSSVAETLAHELAHLVHRRALGTDLPPWLSEGLADAIGDGASLEGLARLEGVAGVEAQAARLRSAYRAGEAGGLERLAGLDRSAFDRGVRSFDYEQSALFTRYLLLEERYRAPFRGYLAKLAAGEAYEQEALRSDLGSSWSDLDAGLEAWLGPVH